MKKQHPLVSQFAENAKSMGAAVYEDKSFAVARLPGGILEIRVDVRNHHATHLLWQLRRKIVSQLEHAPLEKRAGLRASLRGIDALLRVVFENRVGRRNASRN